MDTQGSRYGQKKLNNMGLVSNDSTNLLFEAKTVKNV